MATNAQLSNLGNTYGLGGFYFDSSSVNITTPCVQTNSLQSGNLLCFNSIPALSGWNITADNWLQYLQINTGGALGLGITSPFWTSSNVTFVDVDSLSFTV